MTSSRSQDLAGFQDAAFEPVDGGYLFEIPNPWIFGPGRRFIVTEAQRQALLGTRARNQRLRVALIIAVLCVYTVGVSLLWWLLSGHENPGGLDLAGMAVTLLVPLYIAAVVMVRRYLHRIAPVLATAVPTQARSPWRKRIAIPPKQLNLILTVWVVAVAVGVVGIVIQPTAGNVTMTVFGSAFVAFLVWQRWRNRASAG